MLLSLKNSLHDNFASLIYEFPAEIHSMRENVHHIENTMEATTINDLVDAWG